MNAISEITTILNNSSKTFELIKVAASMFKAIYFSPSAKTLIQVWNAEVKNFSNDEFKSEVNFLLNQVIIYRPNYVISDQRLYQHQITEEQHTWYIDSFVPQLIRYGVKRFGIVINEDLRQQAQLEEIIADVKKYRKEFLIPTRFFSSITKAFEWK
jgi:hypothetical protein